MLGPILEGAISPVMIESAGNETESLRPALNLKPLPLAEPPRNRAVEKLPIEVEVIADIEIQETVGVNVGERRAGAPARVFHTRCSDRKSAVAVVTIENIGA